MSYRDIYIYIYNIKSYYILYSNIYIYILYILYKDLLYIYKVFNRAQKIFLFLVASHLHFFLHIFFFFPNIPPYSISLPFSPCFFLPPFLPSLLSFPSFPFLQFPFPFFLPGKFEHSATFPVVPLPRYFVF